MSWRSPSVVVEELVPAAEVELVEPAADVDVDADEASPVELSWTTNPPERPVVVAGCL